MVIEPERWPEISSLLDEGLALAPAARAAWLAGLAADRSVGDLLARLLEADASAETADFLAALPRFIDEPDAPATDRRVGPYLIEREIGRGGMGAVWLARRSDGLTRPVALKLPHAGLFAGDPALQFSRERDILGALAHPGIARLYDAGIAEGQPYLALEYVAGRALPEHCAARGVDLRGRLILMRQVLAAVQYAHANLVIHRDLKPSNILVTEAGEVKLLDFGIAKLLVQGESAGAARTEVGARALTPDYAAPEQITGGAVTTATDVYSVGVLLYELLTGARPYRMPRGSQATLEAAILGSDPARPSRCAGLATHAATLGLAPERLRRALEGDLDAIVLKALKKEPQQRYATAEALSLDLARYLAAEPVLARPDSAAYRVSRFIRRHRLPVALAAALLIALLGGLGAAVWGARAARAEAARADAVRDFLVGIFSISNQAAGTTSGDLSAREILRRGSERLDATLAAEPRALADLHGHLANIYSSLGANADALAHATRAVALLEAQHETAGDAYLEALYRVANGYNEEEHWNEAQGAYEKLRHSARVRLGPDNRWEALALDELAWQSAMLGNPQLAFERYGQALAVEKRLFGERSAPYLRTLGGSVHVYIDAGRLEDALALVRRLLVIGPQVSAYAYDDQLMDRYEYASILYGSRRDQEAADEFARILPEFERVMGIENDRTFKVRNSLALALRNLGRIREALVLQTRNLRLLLASRVADRDLIAGQLATMAGVLMYADRFDDALLAQGRVVEYFDSKYPQPTAARERFRMQLGDAQIRAGEIEAGIANLRRAESNLQLVPGRRPDSSELDIERMLGNGYRLLGQPERARPLLASACARYAQIMGVHGTMTLRCEVYQVWADSRDPAERLARLAALQTELEAELPARHPLRAELAIVRAELEGQTGDTRLARRDYAAARSNYRAVIGGDPPRPLRALH
jgi:serine/threonine-protein kinase